MSVMSAEHLKGMASQLNCEYEAGIYCEIESFLEWNKKRIAHSELHFCQIDNRYHLKIMLRNLSFQDGKECFRDLLHFIEYSNGTYYVRERYDDHLKYWLLSSIDGSKAFLCEVYIYYSNEQF